MRSEQWFFPVNNKSFIHCEWGCEFVGLFNAFSVARLWLPELCLRIQKTWWCSSSGAVSGRGEVLSVKFINHAREAELVQRWKKCLFPPFCGDLKCGINALRGGVVTWLRDEGDNADVAVGLSWYGYGAVGLRGIGVWYLQGRGCGLKGYQTVG